MKHIGAWPKNDHMLEELITNLEVTMKQLGKVSKNMLFYCWYVDSNRVSKLLLNICKSILNPDSSNANTNANSSANSSNTIDSSLNTGSNNTYEYKHQQY